MLYPARVRVRGIKKIVMAEGKNTRRLYERKFSIEECRPLLGGISRATVVRRIDDGSLGCYRFGDRILIGESHLEEYISRNEHKSRRARKHEAIAQAA
jgi:excisionase family DNA binding protein